MCPPLYYGADGDHADMPFTVMMPTVEQIEALLEKSIQRFAESGAPAGIALRHFAPAQVKMVEDLAARWNASDSRMKVLGLAMNTGKDIPMKPGLCRHV
ncbi:MAG: hypothetical protein R3E89_13955 [Thiolinea sp.]